MWTLRWALGWPEPDPKPTALDFVCWVELCKWKTLA